MNHRTAAYLKWSGIFLLCLAIAISYCALCLLVGRRAAYFSAMFPALLAMFVWAIWKKKLLR